MKKEEIRKEFFKLRIKHHSYNQCRKILKAKYECEATVRTLRRWTKRLNETDWDLRDKSRRPKNIHRRISHLIEARVISLRKQTGWGQEKIADLVPISHKSVNKILNRYNLTNPNPRRKKRIKYVRFQRENPNSLWQIDHSDQKIKNKWLVSVLDDCSRYSLALAPVNRVTTAIVTRLLDELIKKHGKPREILSDNGSAYGLKSKHSKFDRWCRRRGIRHIRSAVHSPTTCGKVERLFQTFKQEVPFCKCSEHFRMRYNHFRPHTSLHRKTPASIYFRG
jgi:transposase InsO family protein